MRERIRPAPPWSVRKSNSLKNVRRDSLPLSFGGGCRFIYYTEPYDGATEDTDRYDDGPGISKWQIRFHYLLYGAVIGAAGGILGTALGYILADPMADYYRVYFKEAPSVTAPLSAAYMLTGTFIRRLLRVCLMD